MCLSNLNELNSSCSSSLKTYIHTISSITVQLNLRSSKVPTPLSKSWHSVVKVIKHLQLIKSSITWINLNKLCPYFVTYDIDVRRTKSVEYVIKSFKQTIHTKKYGNISQVILHFDHLIKQFHNPNRKHC